MDKKILKWYETPATEVIDLELEENVLGLNVVSGSDEDEEENPITNPITDGE